MALCLGVKTCLGKSRTQVKEHCTHTIPGMHMQQCLAVRTLGDCSNPTLLHMCHTRISLFGPYFISQDPLLASTSHITLVLPSGLLTAGTSLANHLVTQSPKVRGIRR